MVVLISVSACSSKTFNQIKLEEKSLTTNVERSIIDGK